MADVEEPQFTSLQQRIAALNQQGVGKSLVAPSAVKKGPPPPPPEQRPALPARRDTSNTSTNGFTKKASGQPTGVKTQLLPPPPVDRDQPRPTSSSKSPSILARNAPPPLPTRKSSQPSPALPPRKSSTQLVPVTSNGRRGSNASTISHSSSISGISLSHYGSSTTSTSSAVERKLPPMLGDTKLPPLPPSRRETEKLASLAKVPLVSTKSAPIVPMLKEPPKMPSRPGTQRMLSRNSADMREDERPAMPSRPSANTREEEAPAQPPRRLPPPKAKVNILSLGFGNPQKTVQDETPSMPMRAIEDSRPNMPSRPVASFAKPVSPGVIELTDSNFDSTINSKHYALVEFFGPRCSLCQYLEPSWKELADDFAFASEKLVIGKMNMGDYPKFHNRFGISRYPTILLFENGEKIAKYSSSLHGEMEMCHKEKEEITTFLEENSGIRIADASQYQKAAPVPPPINMSTRPSDSGSSVRARPRPASTSECLLCRDFSGPDGVASRYPRENLTRERDVVGYLARVLCEPFPSETDKARAIFSWCHHNIAYDTVSFFSKNIKGTTPQNTILSGLAVCQGYAEAFEAIALEAGLEAIVVTGHGKGFGYSPLKAGERPPPYDGNHAWNAVRIDEGEWKLIDPCWGAGPVGNDNVFMKKFNPMMFTMSNEDFGLAHYPENKKYFFRADGSTPTWTQYYIGPTDGEPVHLYSNLRDHGLSGPSFLPVARQISVSSGKTIRFMFSKICEHWDHEKHGEGKPYLFLLKINGVNGKKEDFHPFESNDFWWWADVAATDLGAPGQKVDIYALDTLNGKNARGVTKDEYLKVKGRCGYSFQGIGYWELVK